MSNTIVSGEWPNLPTYKVRLLEDRYDGESDRITRLYRAYGPQDARLQAKQDYPAASVLTVERLEPDGAV